jgi:F5/8 type C domain
MTPSRSPQPARRRRALTTAIATAAIAASTVAGGLVPAYGEPAGPATAPEPDIAHDQAAKTLTLTDGGLRMVVAYGGRAAVTSFTLDGTELLADGMYSTALLAASGTELDSRTLAADPTVKVHGNAVDLAFTLESDEVTIDETWSFDLGVGGIDLEVARDYDWADGATPEIRHNGQLEIGWARVWDNIRRPQDGGNLPIGNAYTGHDGFFLSQPNDRYGVEQSEFVLLADAGEQALAVNADSDRHLATEFAYGAGNTYQETQVSAEDEWAYTTGSKESGFVYSGHTSNGTNRVIFEPVTTDAAQRDVVDFSFAPADYDAYYDLGTVNGVADSAALTSLLNDFGRSGVVDTGYGMSTVGLRYLGTGPYDLALSNPTVFGYYDPAMTQSQKNVLEYFRDYAQGENGHMYGRTYRLTNPWGDNSLADADPAYVAAVAELYEYSPDDEWLAAMRDSVHRSMDFMLQQRYDSPSGMFVNDITSCTSKKSLREWNDAFYVKWQSGYVNELMYRALTLWSELERDVFGDEARAISYAETAASLKEQFNKDTADGGLWDPATGMFAYWRCPDGTVQAAVKHTQLNLQAVAFGMVDVERGKAILDGIDVEMRKNRLPMIPQNFYPVLPNTEEWSGDHFQSGLEDGPIYPFMTEMYMRAANVVGERERSLTYLDNTLARYTEDGFNGWSFLDWSLKKRLGEAWFPTNANAAGGIYTSMLGIQPTADGVTIAPNFPAAMNGSSVTKTIHESDSLTVTYHSVLDQTVRYRTDDDTQRVTMQWSGQEPGASYTVRDGNQEHAVTADDQGVVRYVIESRGEHRVTLVDGDADGFVLDSDVATDLALNAPVTTSSSMEFDRFSAPFATDGARFSTDPSLGWSSDSEVGQDHSEWITVDLGSAQQVGSVHLLPRNYDGRDIGRGFPKAFTIETSVDGETWTPAASEADYPQPSTFAVPEFTFDARDARYVRVTGTSLRTVEGGQYRMQLAEIEVFAPAD